MDIWFTDSPWGMCGDEDGGAMSSFFVFSAMGFYPVCPGKAEYALGTPLFDEIDISVSNGKIFSIRAEGAGEGARYIQEAWLNGEQMTTPFLPHDAVAGGGELVLKMGERPQESWGASTDR